MKWDIKNKLYFGFSLSIIILFAVNFITYNRIHNLNESVRWTHHTHLVLEELDILLSNLIDAETGQRGFLLTGSENYLEPYKNSQIKTDKNVKKLTVLTSDNNQQQMRIVTLISLINNKFKELDQTINLRKSKGFKEALILVKTNTGKILMDNIREVIDEMSNEENNLLDIRLTEQNQATNDTYRIIILLSVISFLLFSISGFFLAKNISIPLNELTNIASRIAKGDIDFSIQAESNRSDEIGVLSNNISSMQKSLQKTAYENKKANQKLEESSQLLKEKNKNLIDININLTSLQEALKKEIESKNKFFSIVAHDMKNPFISLLGLSDIILQDSADLSKKEIVDLVKEMHSASDKTYKLLENLLQWSRSQIGSLQVSPENFVLSDLVNQIIDLLQPNAGLKNIDLQSGVSTSINVFADNDMIEIVIRNLLANAIKFTTDGGVIKISAVRHNEKIDISVEDSGVGIEPEVINKLFNITENVSTEGTGGETGTGLGLILCNEFITKNGGEIRVESEVGKGSKFSFILPAS